MKAEKLIESDIEVNRVRMRVSCEERENVRRENLGLRFDIENLVSVRCES